jgi:stage II sporulation protein AA (anti-sigma F factor antagonist)
MFEVRAGSEEGVVSLVGEFDLAEADAFLEWVGSNVDGQREVVLDCSALTFLDSSGIRAILTFASQTLGSVVVRRPSPTVRKVLEIAGVDEAIGVRVER